MDTEKINNVGGEVPPPDKRADGESSLTDNNLLHNAKDT